MKHENNGKCQSCQQIMDAFPGFHSGLRAWFEGLQRSNPEAHVSCAGRGRQAQEEALKRGASRAAYGSSAHNYNAALDLFELQGDPKNIYEKTWFDTVVKAWVESEATLKWYGEPDAKFFELPHVEVLAWRELAKSNQIKLVE